MAERRAVLRADDCTEKMAVMQIHLQKCLQMPVQKQQWNLVKVSHWDYICITSIQIILLRYPNDTDAESRAELFAETCAGEIKKCAEAEASVDTNAESCADTRADTCAEIAQIQICRDGCGTSRSCRIRGNSM